MEKFTKGPWHIGVAGEIRIETVNTGFGICVMADSEEIDEHNAALIACAPEMYEMLRCLSVAVLKDGSIAHKDAVKLLAKARGES